MDINLSQLNESVSEEMLKSWIRKWHEDCSEALQQLIENGNENLTKSYRREIDDILGEGSGANYREKIETIVSVRYELLKILGEKKKLNS